MQALTQPFKCIPFPVRHIRRVLQPVVLRANEVLDSLRHQGAVFLSSYLVHRLAKVLGYMESVDTDHLFSSRHNLNRSIAI